MSDIYRWTVNGETGEMMLHEKGAYCLMADYEKLSADLATAQREREDWKKKYDEREPTQWAYDQACAALHKKEDQLSAANALIGEMAKVCEFARNLAGPFTKSKIDAALESARTFTDKHATEEKK
jgi:hypothetical protein